MSIDIYLDAGSGLGHGHFNRCLILARAFINENFSTRLVIGSDEKRPCDLARLSNIPCVASKSGVWNSSIEAKANIAFLDVSNSYTQEHLVEFKRWLEKIRNSYASIILLDASGEHAVRQIVSLNIWDLVIVPYPGEQVNIKQTHILAGPEYFILPDEFHQSSENKNNYNEVTTILVTAGGDDDSGFTHFVLEALNSIDLADLTVRCIIGPYFKKNYIADLHAMSETHKYKIIFLEGLTNLAAEMLAADLAIAMTGLTRYELAATGIPTILISIDESHSRMNQAFDKMDIYPHLGVLNKLTIEKLASSIEELAKNLLLRKRMSKRARSVIDGMGLKRIVEAMKEKNLLNSSYT